MPFADLDENLRALEAQGLLRIRRILESAQGAHVTVDGHAYLAFCSNDYLGLAAHPALVEAACQGAAQYGVGAGASHLIIGHTAAHHQLETELAQFLQQDAALLFSTGYMANLGIVTALMGRNDLVLADKLNHASLNDAALLSRARLVRYNHIDLDHLERLLARSSERKKLVVSDAVFSMDGDIAPLPELLALCERYDAYLLVDDAHGLGVLGAHGRGILEHFGVDSPRLIYMATLGKAAGVFGAFVAGHASLIQTLMQGARTYIYTTAMPPLLAVALSASLRLFREEGWRREHLRELQTELKHNLHTERWRLLPSETPIQPLLVGGNKETVALSDALRSRGILVPAIRPPTVPKGQARLRISLSAAHSKDEVRMLAETLNALAAER
jgi:8-amino-7-oxononanoate synthase